MRRWLVAAQIAGSTAFLVIAGLFAQSYSRLSLADMGFDRGRLLVAQFDPASHGFGIEQTERYVNLLRERIVALRGVTDVAVADRVPFFIGFERLTAVSSDTASCEGENCQKVATMAVGAGYFRTMGISLKAGREFDSSPRTTDVIINQPLAAQYWPDRDAVGQTLRIGERAVPVTVVAVTAKTHTRGLDREQPTLYVSLGRDQFERGLTLVARTAVPPEKLIRPVTEAAQALDSHVAMSSVKTMEQRMAVQLWPFRTVEWLFSICGALALTLSVVGLAGVVIYTVNRRVREFGVRLAIGARPQDLVIDVLASTSRVLFLGIGIGTLLAAAGARLVRAAFVGVNVLNPATYLAVALLEVIVVGAACIGPALRASRVDPIAALRAE